MIRASRYAHGHAVEAARTEYRALRAAAATDVQALRKAAQRLHDLRNPPPLSA